MEETLKDVGLSKNEEKVYLTLLEIGLSSGGQIADKAKVHRTNVYDALGRLKEKGLVSYIMRDKVRYFEAADPSHLLAVLQQKQEKLRSILPTLLLRKQLASGADVSVTEGVVAGRNAMMALLNYKEPIYMFGVPKEAPKVLGGFFLERWHKQRIKDKVTQQVIYNEDAAERIRQLKKIKLCEVRAQPDKLNSPMSINICGKEVFFGLWSRDPVLIIRIIGADVAEIFTKYFQVVWKVARKL